MSATSSERMGEHTARGRATGRALRGEWSDESQARVDELRMASRGHRADVPIYDIGYNMEFPLSVVCIITWSLWVRTLRAPPTFASHFCALR